MEKSRKETDTDQEEPGWGQSDGRERDKRRNMKSSRQTDRQTGTEARTERGTGQSLSSEPEGSPIEGGCCLQSHQPRDPEVPHFRATGRDPKQRHGTLQKRAESLKTLLMAPEELG